MIYLREGCFRDLVDPLAVSSTSWDVRFDETRPPLYKEDQDFKGMGFYTPIAPTCLEKW